MKTKTLRLKDLSRITKSNLNDTVWCVPPSGTWKIVSVSIKIVQKERRK